LYWGLFTSNAVPIVISESIKGALLGCVYCCSGGWYAGYF